MTEVKEAPINYPGRLRHSVEEARGFCKTCSCAARLEDWPSDNEDGRGKSGKALQIQPGRSSPNIASSRTSCRRASGHRRGLAPPGWACTANLRRQAAARGRAAFRASRVSCISSGVTRPMWPMRISLPFWAPWPAARTTP